MSILNLRLEDRSRPTGNHRCWLGPAGSGKSHRVRVEREHRADLDVTAVTGIAAVNLDCGAKTPNALLHYKNTEDLAVRHREGELEDVMRDRREVGITEIVIDEVSMLSAASLDIIVDAADKAGMRLLLTGDFAQLGPIAPKDHDTGRRRPVGFAFEAASWSQFEIERLTGSWRHKDDPKFLEVLTGIRHGHLPATAVDMLKPSMGGILDWNFDGVTIVATHVNANAINDRRLLQLPGPPSAFTAERYGEVDPEWETIPSRVDLRLGAYVVLRRNKRGLVWVNGDTGYITGLRDGSVEVLLDRTKETVTVKPVTELYLTAEDELKARKLARAAAVAKTRDRASAHYAFCYYEALEEARSLLSKGSITFMPVQLAYALVVHRTQGLTLEKVQVHLGENMMAAHGMAYTALSRVRSRAGLRIAGNTAKLRELVCAGMDSRVQPWI